MSTTDRIAKAQAEARIMMDLQLERIANSGLSLADQETVKLAAQSTSIQLRIMCMGMLGCDDFRRAGVVFCGILEEILAGVRGQLAGSDDVSPVPRPRCSKCLNDCSVCECAAEAVR